jgi:hypothetical protein
MVSASIVADKKNKSTRECTRMDHGRKWTQMDQRRKWTQMNARGLVTVRVNGISSDGIANTEVYSLIKTVAEQQTALAQLYVELTFVSAVSLAVKIF